jgi:hypothetical protein
MPTKRKRQWSHGNLDVVACFLFARDPSLTQEEIAWQLGCTTRSLRSDRICPRFKEAWNQHKDALKAERIRQKKAEKAEWIRRKEARKAEWLLRASGELRYPMRKVYIPSRGWRRPMHYGNMDRDDAERSAACQVSISRSRRGPQLRLRITVIRTRL